MNNPLRNSNRPAVILLVVLACAFLFAAGAALVSSIHWQTVLSTARAPPNGTTGSAQPGTIGLARPHPPLPER